MNFLPEEDQDFLAAKQITYELVVERLPDGNERRGVVFTNFALDGHLSSIVAGATQPCRSCGVLVLIPFGYSTTRLDSFYTSTALKRADGAMPINTAPDHDLFGRKWQFWSRHLGENEWRAGQDGLDTYLQYVRAELQKA